MYRCIATRIAHPPAWVGPPMRFLTAIPVHNEEKYLEGVLREVSRHADNILVVDDGSTDRTPDLLRRFPAVEVVRHPRNLGYGAGLEDGLSGRRSRAATTVL